MARMDHSAVEAGLARLGAHFVVSNVVLGEHAVP
jgi:hypothetical protein